MTTPAYGCDTDIQSTPTKLSFSGDFDDDGIVDGIDLDDDNDGITDVAENVFITYYKNYKISNGGSAGKATPIT